MSASSLEALLSLQLRALGIKPYVPELKFGGSLGRKWRFDMAWPLESVAVEIQGGVFSGGRHVRGYGYEGDCEKLCAAVLLGWRVLPVTGKQVESGVAASRIAQALRGGEVDPELFARRPKGSALNLRGLRAKSDGRGNRRNDRGRLPQDALPERVRKAAGL